MLMKSFYIATGLEHAEEQKALARELESLGFQQTYNWAAHGSVQAEGPERIKEVAIAEVDGVLDAELFIALLPGARGTHTELGIAIANARQRQFRGHGGERTILIVGPTEDAGGRTCCFYFHPQVDERFATVGELLAWLKSWRRCNPLPTARSA